MTSSSVRVAMTWIIVAVTAAAQPARAADAPARETIAVMGTGDMGDSFGPRLAQLGYRVIYGSRSPDSERVRALVARTGDNASAATYADASINADIILLALPWRPLPQILDSFGDTAGKIIIDLTWPESVVEADGYERIVVETSAAEMIQAQLPGARVVKAFGTTGSNIVDDPSMAGGPVSIPIASDDRAAKEWVGRLAAELGFDPIDAGPLRMARHIEAMMELYLVPMMQERETTWEFYFRRTRTWSCDPYTGGEFPDDMPPIVDAGNLAVMPETQPPAPPCKE